MRITKHLIFVLICIGLSSACSERPPSSTSMPQTKLKTETPVAIKDTPTQTATLEAPPAPTASSVHIPDAAGYTWEIISDHINAPTDIQSARDGSGRIFITERPGRIRIIKNNQLAENPFLDITNITGSKGAEQGLLGLAFHPNFSQNDYYYINYTDKNGNTHISRFTAFGDGTIDGSEKQILIVQQPFPNHNGGALAFGPDGYLYIGLGDGGSGGDPYGNAQSTNTMLGKILRIDVNSGDPYSIPPDNPYTSENGGYPEIWAIGLRNPWRFSFDRQTGHLCLADVGQDQWEEVNFVPAGTLIKLNFGWNLMEASHPYNESNEPELYSPVTEYQHGPECSITGGVVYSGPTMPEWQGVYFYGDFCSGKIWGLPTPPNGNPPSVLFQTNFRISTFGLDEDGEVLLADYSGAIYKLVNK